jgi:hypothetical protein
MTAASFRSHFILKQGKYRFEGVVSTVGVTPLNFGKVHGATLRLMGRPRMAGELVGDKEAQKLEVTFEVSRSEEEIETICELRASKGDAWFDLESLRLVDLGPEANTNPPK